MTLHRSLHQWVRADFTQVWLDRLYGLTRAVYGYAQWFLWIKVMSWIQVIYSPNTRVSLLVASCCLWRNNNIGKVNNCSTYSLFWCVKEPASKGSILKMNCEHANENPISWSHPKRWTSKQFFWSKYNEFDNARSSCPYLDNISMINVNHIFLYM